MCGALCEGTCLKLVLDSRAHPPILESKTVEWSGTQDVVSIIVLVAGLVLYCLEKKM